MDKREQKGKDGDKRISKTELSKNKDEIKQEEIAWKNTYKFLTLNLTKL